MKKTRNGILIPDVPIMAGGNLPNAVKGVSAGGGVNWREMGGYLESTSRVQQVDLLLPTQEFVAELDMAVISSITNAAFFGYIFNNIRSYIRQYPNDATRIEGFVDYDKGLSPMASVNIGDRYKLTFEVRDGISTLAVDDVVIGTYSGTPQKLATLYVFNSYEKTETHFPTLGGMIRLWSLKVTTLDGEVLRDMWPVYTSDNTPALYDYISNLFYVNTGEGELICSYL